MTETTQLCRHSPWFALFGIAISCTLIVLLSGCAERQVKARTFPWSTFAYARPLAPPVSQTQIPAQVDDVDPLEDATLDVAPPPSVVAIARSVPARPRVPAGNPSQSDNGSSKPEVPQIAPQLTAAETSAAQQQMTQSLGVAERNIGSAEGKALNATQQDLASKVRSFMAEARDAASNGDWTRARAAAKKAEVLSQELASSL
jgi:hypothetical protein